MKWEKIDRIENEEGTTIKYCTEGSVFGSKFILVESRKRHIPHANAKGPHDTWDHTSYFVTRNGQDIKEFWRLSEAKEFAEKLWEETKDAELSHMEVDRLMCDLITITNASI